VAKEMEGIVAKRKEALRKYFYFLGSPHHCGSRKSTIKISRTLVDKLPMKCIYTTSARQICTRE
jgi:hypothetical protein